MWDKVTTPVAKLVHHDRVRSLARATGNHTRQLRLDRQLRDVWRTLPNTVPDDALMGLWATWGDELTSSRMPYLRAALAEAARAEGPIVQCGGDLSSVLIGMICHQAEIPEKHLWVIEHNAHWSNVIRSWIERYEIAKAHVIASPAELFDGFVWYVLDPARLPQGFSLVLCEGSSALPASARGVVERLADRLDHRCVILARNAKRPRDLKFVSDWAKSQGAPIILQEGNEPYVKIAMRDRRVTKDTTAPPVASSR